MRATVFLLATVLVVTGLAGCAGPKAASSVGAPKGLEDGEGFLIQGIVIDTEVVPLEAAHLVLTPGDLQTNTTADGGFRFGPLPAGDYELTVTKNGYAAATLLVSIVQSQPDRITITLAPATSTVPYHETHIFVAYIFCTVTVFGVFAPCLPVNVLTGQNVTQDRAEFNFRIPAPNLMDLLHEMEWLSQATGVDMSVTIRPPNLAVVAGGVTDIYLQASGSSPMRNLVTPGKMNGGANKEFTADETASYTTIIRGSDDNSTTGLSSLYLDHRVNNYFTFFYNRGAPPEFTVIPDQ